MRFGPGHQALAVLACVALISACSNSNSTPVTTPTPTPTPLTSGTPTVASVGIAYIPDGGSTAGSTGIYTVNFEDTNGHLLPSRGPTAAPVLVRFPAPVGPIGFSPDGVNAIAATTGTGGAYNLIQAIFGLSSGSLVPVGTPYNAAVAPTPTSSPAISPTSDAAAIVPSITGASVIGVSSLSVGLVVGPSSTGILGAGSINAAPPIFGGFVPFQDGTVSFPPGNAFYNIEVSLDDQTVLVRGPSAAEAFTIVFPVGTFQFTKPVVALVGYGAAPMYGRGGMAISPADSTAALLLRNPGPNDVEYISGLPGSITAGSHLTLKSQPNSIAIVPNSTGNLAVVGTSAGFYVISGATTGALKLEQAYLPLGTDGAANSPVYTGCDGMPHHLENVTSIGISADYRYVAALGYPTGSTCGSLVAVPLVDTTGGTPTPSPTPSPGTTNPPVEFVQNNLPAPSPNVDYMRVR